MDNHQTCNITHGQGHTNDHGAGKGRPDITSGTDKTAGGNADKGNKNPS
nr:hypothetical protein [uncultured Desulfobacter sp.]